MKHGQLAIGMIMLAMGLMASAADIRVVLEETSGSELPLRSEPSRPRACVWRHWIRPWCCGARRLRCRLPRGCGIVSVARAYESCGQPKQALAFIEAQLPSVTDMTEREGAEMHAIMAKLADMLGQHEKAMTLRKAVLAVLAVPHVRPQLAEAVQAASQ